MPAHLTAAEARALGIDPKRGRAIARQAINDVIDEARGKRTTRKTAPGPYRTVCHDCGEVFTTRAAEDRHVTDAQHWRYELDLSDAQRGRPGHAI